MLACLLVCVNAYVLVFGCFSGRRTAYNWLTGNSVDTLAEYSLPASESMSSLLVFGKKNRPASWKSVGAGFGSKRSTAPSDEADSRSAGDQTVTDNQPIRQFYTTDRLVNLISIGLFFY